MNWNNWNRKADSKYETILLGLLAGAAAGLAVGLLLAPKSGDKLRGEIRDAIDESLGSAKQKADNLRNSALNLAQRGLKEMQRTKDVVAQKTRTAVSDAIATGARHAHGAVDQTVSAAQSAAKKTHDAIDGASDAVRTETAA